MNGTKGVCAVFGKERNTSIPNNETKTLYIWNK